MSLPQQDFTFDDTELVSSNSFSLSHFNKAFQRIYGYLNQVRGEVYGTSLILGNTNDTAGNLKGHLYFKKGSDIVADIDLSPSLSLSSNTLSVTVGGKTATQDISSIKSNNAILADKATNVVSGQGIIYNSGTDKTAVLAGNTTANQFLSHNNTSSNKNPKWVNASDMSVGSATKATQDESSNNIKASYGASLSLSGTSLSLVNKNNTSLSSVTLSKSNVGLGNVDNTSDANKSVKYASYLGDSSSNYSYSTLNDKINNRLLFIKQSSTSVINSDEAHLGKLRTGWTNSEYYEGVEVSDRFFLAFVSHGMPYNLKYEGRDWNNLAPFIYLLGI